MEKHTSPIIAVYPGSFDPITNGHVDIIRRASGIFDRVIIAVAEALHKNTLFTLKERIDFVEEAVKDMPNVEVKPLSGRLLVDFCKEVGATIIVRGLRAVSDFEYEFKLAWINRRLHGDIETVFLIPSEEYAYLASSLVKEIATLGGKIDGLVPYNVAEALYKKKEEIKRKGTGEPHEQSL